MSFMRAGIAPLISLSLIFCAFGYAEAQQAPSAAGRSTDLECAGG